MLPMSQRRRAQIHLTMMAAGVMAWIQALAEQNKKRGDRWKMQLLTHITLSRGGLRNWGGPRLMGPRRQRVEEGWQTRPAPFSSDER